LLLSGVHAATASQLLSPSHSAIQAHAAPDIRGARPQSRSPTMIIAGYALLALGYTLLAIATLSGIGH
jgi:hypothetical protein